MLVADISIFTGGDMKHRALNADFTPYTGSFTLLERRPVKKTTFDITKLENAIKELEKKHAPTK